MARIRSKRRVTPRGGVPAEITTEGLDSIVWRDADLVHGFCDAYGLPAPPSYVLPSPRACRDHAAASWAKVNGYVNRFGGVHWAQVAELDIPGVGRARIRARIAALKGK